MMHNFQKYKELVFCLAKTDFKLRYHGSVLGYVWALLKPLLFFLVVNFVFSSIFSFRGSDIPFYSLGLLTALLMFHFFVEGTNAGLMSLWRKSQLITKIYIPKWTIIFASTLNSLFLLLANLVVLVGFFIVKGKIPSLEGVLFFFLAILCLYVLILAFSFLFATLYVRFRDLSMIWDVMTSMLMYATPIVYPLSLVPENLQKIILLNPLAFIIHSVKEALLLNNFPNILQIGTLIFFCIGILALAILVFQKTEKKVVEYI